MSLDVAPPKQQQQDTHHQHQHHHHHQHYNNITDFFHEHEVPEKLQTPSHPPPLSQVPKPHPVHTPHPQRVYISNQSPHSTHSHKPTKQLVQQILQTVNELEHTLNEDHQHDFELRMAFARQAEKLDDLHSSLKTERVRNQRLLQLIRGVDSCSSAEEENLAANQWQSRTSTDTYDSISPLLLQQRYDELSASYKQCQRQLARKEKMLVAARCEKEEIQSRYDQLLDEYRNEQKRIEELCFKYLKLQAKKNQEIQRLRDTLSFASDCILNAQQICDHIELHYLECEYSKENPNPKGNNQDNSMYCKSMKEFRQNLQSFIKALKLCQWAQSSRRQRHTNATYASSREFQASAGN